MAFAFDLFGQHTKDKNLLPYDGIVHYFGKIFNTQQADHYYQQLLTTIAWKNDEAMMFGKHIITKRKAAWYGDKPFAYTYSKITKQAHSWTKELLELKAIAEKETNATYNSCLLNLYHRGDEGMAWHSDDEKELDNNAAIASLSFGAARKFAFKHKTTGETVSVVLEHGSLLVMKDVTQQHWWHRLPPTKTVHTPRINLTFRKMNEQPAT